MVKMLRRSQHLPDSAPTLFTTPLRRQPATVEAHEAVSFVATEQHQQHREHALGLPSSAMHTGTGLASSPTVEAEISPIAPLSASGVSWSGARRTASADGGSPGGASQGAVLYSPSRNPVMGRISPQKKKDSPNGRSPEVSFAPTAPGAAPASPLQTAAGNTKSSSPGSIIAVDRLILPSTSVQIANPTISLATAASVPPGVGVGVVFGGSGLRGGFVQRGEPSNVAHKSEEAAEATAALVKFCSCKHSEYDTERMHQAISFKEREGLTNALLEMLRWCMAPLESMAPSALATRMDYSPRFIWLDRDGCTRDIEACANRMGGREWLTSRCARGRLKASKGTLSSTEILSKMDEYERLEAAAISRTFQAGCTPSSCF